MEEYILQTCNPSIKHLLGLLRVSSSKSAYVAKPRVLDTCLILKLDTIAAAKNDKIDPNPLF